ncbi:MAG: cupin domain-containing protein [Pseudomonadales bacterium]
MSEQTVTPKGKRYVSERGGFKLNANPAIGEVVPRAKIRPERSAAGFAHEPLASKYGPEAAAKKIGEMVKAFIPGTITTTLLAQGGHHGMSLVHVWFGANFPLFRHSHPRYGDCLYYVIAGEILLGQQRLGAGSTFFVPNGQPYKYTAGPAGVELLEFRAGGGDPQAPGMQLDESSFEAIDKIIKESYDNDEAWVPPKKMGDTAIRQALIEGRLPEQTALEF